MAEYITEIIPRICFSQSVKKNNWTPGRTIQRVLRRTSTGGATTTEDELLEDCKMLGDCGFILQNASIQEPTEIALCLKSVSRGLLV